MFQYMISSKATSVLCYYTKQSVIICMHVYVAVFRTDQARYLHVALSHQKLPANLPQ